MYVAVGVDLRGATAPDVHISSVLIGPDGCVIGVHNKHVLWDYEYTLFVAGSEQYQVFKTPIGVIGLLLCADGILPETPRALSLLGAQILCNSLNSRGPDEARMHIPLRSMESAVWHIASNTVGNPSNVGLLWPCTGGSQIVAPDGTSVASCGEEEEEMVWADIQPALADLKTSNLVDNVMEWRRPDLYGVLTQPLDVVPAAAMYGPAPEIAEGPAPQCVKVAMMQISRYHTRQCTEWVTARQIDLAGRRKAHLGVLPELFCFAAGEVAKDVAAAAAYSATILSQLQENAKQAGIFVAASLVEEDAGAFYHTAYLLNSQGEIVGSYRKAHLNREEQSWAAAGQSLATVMDTEIGKLALMIGDEVWIPEVGRALGVLGAEIVIHPCNWDRPEAPNMAAVERTSENRYHLVSVARLDNKGLVGSQVVFAGEFVGGEPIALMRFPMAQWMRYGVEEQMVVDLHRREAHCKMMGFHLDVLAKRAPECYGMFV